MEVKDLTFEDPPPPTFPFPDPDNNELKNHGWNANSCEGCNYKIVFYCKIFNINQP